MTRFSAAASHLRLLLDFAATVLIFFIAGLLHLLRFEHVDNLGGYRIPSETGLLNSSDFNSQPYSLFR